MGASRVSRTISVVLALLRKEIDEVRERQPQVWPAFEAMYRKIEAGERDLYF